PVHRAASGWPRFHTRTGHDFPETAVALRHRRRAGVVAVDSVDVDPGHGAGARTLSRPGHRTGGAEPCRRAVADRPGAGAAVDAGERSRGGRPDRPEDPRTAEGTGL